MQRSEKILLTISAVLILAFAMVLGNDYVQFHNNMEGIIYNLETASPDKIEAAWFTIVVYRSALFLIPAFVCGFIGLHSWIRDNMKPRSGKKN